MTFAFQLAKVLPLWVSASISVRKDCSESSTTQHVFHPVHSVPVFQDSGIPDSFPVYHYNGLKQSNHKERVRHSGFSL